MGLMRPSKAASTDGPMPDSPLVDAAQPTVGPKELVNASWAIFRTETARVVVPAVIVFGAAAAIDTYVEVVEYDHNSVAVTAIITALLLVSSLGLTFYAGLLDRLVGAKEEGLEPPPMGQVLRTLPYGRLFVADIVLWFSLSLSSTILVIPGLIFCTFFAIVGPVINMEERGIVDAFRRSYHLIRPRVIVAFVMVTMPLVLEHEIVALIDDFLPTHTFINLFIVGATIGTLFGMAVGLVEVSLAERLIHVGKGPQPPAASQA
jgi:hypothetical protein